MCLSFYFLLFMFFEVNTKFVFLFSMQMHGFFEIKINIYYKIVNKCI